MVYQETGRDRERRNKFRSVNNHNGIAAEYNHEEISDSSNLEIAEKTTGQRALKYVIIKGNEQLRNIPDTGGRHGN